MSRSYRKPYAAICGHDVSAKDDKRLAARGVRRKQNQWLRTTQDFEENGLVPHRLECHWNEVYGWSRDGKQRYIALTKRDWAKYCRIEQGLFHSAWERRWEAKHPNVWPPKWYADIKRK